LFTAAYGSVRLWDLSSVLVSHPGYVTTVRLNHRGDLLATGGRDRTVRLWRVDGDRTHHLATLDLPYHPRSLSISPDDRTLVLDGDGPTQVWDISAPTRPVRAANLPETNNNVSIAFSPTDTTVVIAHANRTTMMYDLADPYHPKVADDLAPFAVDAVAFDPTGTMLAVTQNGYPQVWDPSASVTTRKLTTSLTPAWDSVAAFAPDGRTLSVFLNENRETQLWGMGDPRHPDVLATFRPRVPDGATRTMVGPAPVYSADSRLLAGLDGDRTVRLWDVSDPREPKDVTAFDFGRLVQSLDMTPDGRQLFAATEENVVQRRYLDVDDVAKRICTIAHPRISAAQWREHFQDLPYQPPCR
jgi:WD40 repeat protein